MIFGQGPTIMAEYHRSVDQPRFIFDFNSPFPTEPFISKSGDWKVYPTKNQDWSHTPKEVWNPNVGACYPKLHIELGYKIQFENLKKEMNS